MSRQATIIVDKPKAPPATSVRWFINLNRAAYGLEMKQSGELCVIKRDGSAVKPLRRGDGLQFYNDGGIDKLIEFLETVKKEMNL